MAINDSDSKICTPPEIIALAENAATNLLQSITDIANDCLAAL